MGIAKYFSKDLLAINQLINSSTESLENILLTNRVGLAFDSNAVDTKEGNKFLDILIRLIARLYPTISVLDLSGENFAKVTDLISLAKGINSNIEISTDPIVLDVLLIAGYSKSIPKIKGKILYIGSNNWNAKFSQSKPQDFSDSTNPFGCGIAACIAASNTFRIIFKEFLPEKVLDDNLEFSVINYSTVDTSFNPKLKAIQFVDVALVGIGAIGNGAIWALTNLNNLTGNLDLIDNETISLSNIQRYIMFSEEDINQSKVSLALDKFKNSKIKVRPFSMTWAYYLQERNKWDIETVAVAIDNKKDRIGIQSSLPKKIFNAYTESNFLGVARHLDFTNSACLACGYIPSQKEKNYINEVADNCNIPTLSNLVKDYINLNLPVDKRLSDQSTSSMLDLIAQANNINRNDLTQFHGKRVMEFYSEFICGGISMSLSNSEKKLNNVDAPLAFQSAMAGILLAAELVIESSNLRESPIKQQSHFYPLNAIGQNNPFNHSLLKDNSGRCLCGDQDFIKQYNLKWPNPTKTK